MTKNFLLLLLFMGIFIFLSLPDAIAQDYYADIAIDVKRDGVVIIDGITNYEGLLTDSSPDYTSKEGKYWVLNVSKDEVFSSFIFRVNFPENTQINYIKTPDLRRIEHTDRGLSIVGTGEDKELFVIVQYSFNSFEEEKKTTNYFITIVLAFILIFVSGLFFYWYYRKSFRKKAFYDKTLLTDRQRLILDIVEKNKNVLSQRDIEIKSGLAKSSVSRNIQSLVLKGILKKEVKGMSNIISLNVPQSSGRFRKK